MGILPIKKKWAPNVLVRRKFCEGIYSVVAEVNNIENHRFPPSRTSGALDDDQEHLGQNCLSRSHKSRNFSGNVPVTETRDFRSLGGNKKFTKILKTEKQ